MNSLTTKHCEACEGGVPALSDAEKQKYLAELHEWLLSNDGKMISRKFSFKGFAKTMAFVNAVAWIATKESHHPDVKFGFNYCDVTYTTHAIDGLSINDFICAAKVDALLN